MLRAAAQANRLGDDVAALDAPRDGVGFGVAVLVQLHNTLQTRLAAGATLETSILDFLRP